MRLYRRPPLSLALAAALTLLVASADSDALGARTLPSSPSPDVAAGREVARIQAHFDSVLSELAASPVDRGESRARRAALVTTLRAYRNAGNFPHNYDFAGRAVPYFVDRRTGTLCAVAHLLASTGRRDIVDRVARTDNNVWVAALAGDTAFTSWLEVNGITLAEAARIQVPYVQPVTPIPSESPTQKVGQTELMTVAPIALGTAALTTLINAYGNADGHRRSLRIAGFASGVLAATAGGLLMAKGADAGPKVGAATAAVGGLSILLASRATVRHHAVVAREREAERSRSVQAALSPTIGGSGAGIALAIRY